MTTSQNNKPSGDLFGQVVLITGASAGIGESLARELAGRGADLILLARRTDKLEALAQELRQSGIRVVCLGCDVTKEGDLETAVFKARAELGKIDMVIANAGFGVSGYFEDLKLEDFRRQFETNVFGVVRTAYATLDELKRTRGKLVIIGSVSGHLPTPTTSAYCMSKFAVRAFSDTLRCELKRYGVSVTLISPGFIATDIRKVDNRGRYHADANDMVPAWIQMPATKAAHQIIQAALKKKREKIITFHGKVFVFLNTLFPTLINFIFSKAKPNPLRKDLNN